MNSPAPTATNFAARLHERFPALSLNERGSALRQWQNWPLVVKLAAVILVPTLFATILGAVHIRSDVREAEAGEHMSHLIHRATAVRVVTGELQAERTLVAGFLPTLDSSHPAFGSTPADLTARFARTDQQISHSHDLLQPHVGERVDPASEASAQKSSTSPRSTAAASPPANSHQAQHTAERELARLPELRGAILHTGGERMVPTVAVAEYTRIIHSLLTAHRWLVTELSHAELNPSATALQEMTQNVEEIRLQQAMVHTGLLTGFLPSETLDQLHDSQIRREAALAQWRSVASPEQHEIFQRVSQVPAVQAWEHSRALVEALPSSRHGVAFVGNPPHITPQTWIQQTEDALSALENVQSGIDGQLHAAAYRLYDEASNGAGLASVVLLTTLLLAVLLTWAVARQLTTSLHTLRRNALDIARTRLPQVVTELRTGQQAHAPAEALPVTTTEEIGQVARAFDDVHTQAVNLAVDQAGLRQDLRDSFVNISRRSQVLLEHQLRLFEHLERDEEDPDQLATLFQLDHLSTRMRRNNENLMVLAGIDPIQRFTEPTSLDNLLRAAISEIEHYPRVKVHPFGSVQVVAYLANDLMRLFAELLDNAANFSPPETTVHVSCHPLPTGAVEVSIVDYGIGLSAYQLEITNRRLRATDQYDIRSPRRMGLLVVGRLASRHGVAVELETSPARSGTRASVILRPDLLAQPAREQSPVERREAPVQRKRADPEPVPSLQPVTQPQAAVDYTPAGLPRRQPRAHVNPELARQPEAPLPSRDAETIRARMSSFQRGVREGRHAQRTEDSLPFIRDYRPEEQTEQ